MNYIKHLNMFGVEAKEIPCIEGTGAPTAETVGALGSLYIDSNTGFIYKCINVAENAYTWDYATPQADQEQNDATAPDYIKNRPFYEKQIEAIEEEIVPSTIFTNNNSFSGNQAYMEFPATFIIEPDTDYKVEYDGETYYYHSFSTMTNSTVFHMIGNISLYDSAQYNNNEPIIIGYTNYWTQLGSSAAAIIYADTEKTSHTVSITKLTPQTEIKKIDPKFLPSGGVGYSEIMDTIIDADLIPGPGEPEYDISWNQSTTLVKINGKLEPGKKYTVVLDSGTYEVECNNADGDSAQILGVLTDYSATNPTDVSYPFGIMLGSLLGVEIPDGYALVSDGYGGKHIKIIASEPVEITQAIEPKYLPNGGDGVGYGGHTILERPTFNGNLDEYETIALDGTTWLVKVAENCPAVEDVVGATITIKASAGILSQVVTETDIQMVDEQNFMIADTIGCVSTEAIEFQGVTVSRGTWFMYSLGFGYVSSFDVQLEAIQPIHKINPKYINSPFQKINKAITVTSEQLNEEINIGSAILKNGDKIEVITIDGQTIATQVRITATSGCELGKIITFLGIGDLGLADAGMSTGEGFLIYATALFGGSNNTITIEQMLPSELASGVEKIIFYPTLYSFEHQELLLQSVTLDFDLASGGLNQHDAIIQRAAYAFAKGNPVYGIVNGKLGKIINMNVNTMSSIYEFYIMTLDDFSYYIAKSNIDNGFSIQEFSFGKDGYTPVKGTDYWTDEDKAEIKAYVDEAILGGAW